MSCCSSRLCTRHSKLWHSKLCSRRPTQPEMSYRRAICSTKNRSMIHHDVPTVYSSRRVISRVTDSLYETLEWGQLEDPSEDLKTCSKPSFKVTGIHAAVDAGLCGRWLSGPVLRPYGDNGCSIQSDVRLAKATASVAT